MRNKELQIFNPSLAEMFGYSGFDAAAKLGKKAKELFQIWQAHIPHYEVVTETKCKIALSVFIEHFGANKNKWRSFCAYVAKSKKLMGKGRKKLKISLCWAVQRENLRKILQGKYHTDEEKQSIKGAQ